MDIKQTFSDEFADRSMILTNALLRTDELREDATPRQVIQLQLLHGALPRHWNKPALNSVSYLECGPDEVDVQRFLRRNPILFHRFAPSRILSEARILTKYRTDFVIVSENKELALSSSRPLDAPPHPQRPANCRLHACFPAGADWSRFEEELPPAYAASICCHPMSFLSSVSSSPVKTYSIPLMS